MGFEWPDKCDKTGFGSVARGGGNIFHGHPPQLNSVVYGVDWVTGLFSLFRNMQKHGYLLWFREETAQENISGVFSYCQFEKVM